MLGSRENSKPRVREMLAVGAADWASELRANIAHPKRMSAGAPQRPVHAVLAGVLLCKTARLKKAALTYGQGLYTRLNLQLKHRTLN